MRTVLPWRNGAGGSTARGVARAISLLRRLPLEEDGGAASRAFGRVLALARAHGLTAYDAGYLDVALRWGIPLATDDAALRAAANAAGVALLGAA